MGFLAGIKRSKNSGKIQHIIQTKNGKKVEGKRGKYVEKALDTTSKEGFLLF